MNDKEQFQPIIDSYIKYLDEKKLEDEIYKWKAIKHFQDTWDPDAEDFGKMFEEAVKLQNNIMNYRAAGMMRFFCRNHPEKWKEMILNLYEGDDPLSERMNHFRAVANGIAKEENSTWSDYQDERAMSVYLTFRYPEKYIHYKNSFYKELANKLGVKVVSAGKKFDHFQLLAQDFKNEYLMPDEELIKEYRKILPADVYQDPELNLLTQDFLFFMDYKSKKKKNINYWIFQANPKVYRVIDALKDNVIKNWRAKAHKDELKKGDKFILWVAGAESGCYALGTVQSEVYNGKDSDIEHEYSYSDDNVEEDRVDVKIDYNFWDNPILKDDIVILPEFKEFYGGYQGTNFTATEEQYNTILDMVNEDNSKINYWLIGAGVNGVHWDEFYDKSIVAIGMEGAGDLRNYQSKEQLEKELQKIEGTERRKYNDALLGYEFVNEVKIGDVMIAKKSNNIFLGYGIVESDYYYDDSTEYYKNARKVKWIKKGEWIEEKGTIVQKALTNITKYKSAYPNYRYYYERILALMNDEFVDGNESLPKKMKSFPLNQILHGPPGTGKTYETIDLAVEIIDGEIGDHMTNKSRFDVLRDTGQIEFITFHQNYAYEDFIVGIRPDAGAEDLHFIPYKGVFYKICQLARDNYIASLTGNAQVKTFDEAFEDLIAPIEDDKEVEIIMPSGKKFWIYEVSERTIFFRKSNGSTKHTLSISTLKELESGSREMLSGLSAYYQPLIEMIRQKRRIPGIKSELKRYVLIIDEINRANISRVFGELITLLEDDKRLGAENELKVTLPSGEKNFSVPQNLYIIGTMNTADKSIALLDIALRRRFVFKGKYPMYHKLSEYVTEKLSKLNEAIKEAKKSPDFMIGHAYFINKPDTKFNEIMNNQVIPLLYEYFNGRETFVKEILDKAELNPTLNPHSFIWEIK